MHRARLRFRAGDTNINHAATTEVEVDVEWDEAGRLWINAADRCILRIDQGCPFTLVGLTGEGGLIQAIEVSNRRGGGRWLRITPPSPPTW